MNEAQIIDKLSCPDKIGLDVGANHGCYTGTIAGKVKHVYAFEPHADNFRVLTENCGNLPNVSLINKAVGTVNEPIKFYINSGNPGGHTAAPLVGSVTTWGHDPNITITVDCISLDEYFKDRLDIGFMKIDVEGYEEWVLKGASNLLDTNDIIIALECHQTINCKEIYDFMTNKGYSFWEDDHLRSKIERDHRYLIKRGA